MREEIPGLTYVPDFLTTGEETHLLQVILYSHKTHTWLWKPYHRSRWERASFGWEYVAHSRLREAPPLPPLLAEWRDRCAQKAGIQQMLEQVSVNWYPQGSGIGEHIDDEAFGEPIIVLSLGSTAEVQWKKKETGRVITETIEPRSLYIESGEARSLWSHRVLPVPAERCVVVFRPLGKAQLHQSVQRKPRPRSLHRHSSR